MRPTRRRWHLKTLTKVMVVVVAGFMGIGWTAPEAAAAMLAMPSAGDPTAPTQLELEQRLVAAQLTMFGLSEEQVAQRVTLLTEAEIHQLAQGKSAISTGADLTMDQEQWLLWGGVVLGATATVLSIIALAED